VNNPHFRVLLNGVMTFVIAHLVCLPVSAQVEKPRLVIQITVDQFRGDLPTRYADRLGEGGLRYLLDPVALFRYRPCLAVPVAIVT